MKMPESIADLERLIRDKVPESIHLDYKASPAIENKKNEISKDVSAFANSDGGLIIFGINEDGHIPKELDTGIDHKKYDREYLENVITSNIAPILDNFLIHQIPLSDARSFFVIKIEKSFNAPHQDRKSKKYHKRFNFKSEPMEDYEIQDIRNRSNFVAPLINMDIEMKDAYMTYLVVSNIGTLTAKDVKFEFSQKLNLPYISGELPLFERGIKFFPPGRRFAIMYDNYPAIIAKDSETLSRFDVSVSYYHPAIGKRKNDTFHIDLVDFLNTECKSSDTRQLLKKVEKGFEDLTKEIKTLNATIKHFQPMVNPTGLNLSMTTMRNLNHLSAEDTNFEKLDVWHHCDEDIFREVLGIDISLASSIRHHFWVHRQNLANIDLSSISGMTDKIIENFYEHFFIAE